MYQIPIWDIIIAAIMLGSLYSSYNAYRNYEIIRDRKNVLCSNITIGEFDSKDMQRTFATLNKALALSGYDVLCKLMLFFAGLYFLLEKLH